MRARLMKLGVVTASLGTLAFGGVALANSGGKAKPRPAASGTAQGQRDSAPDTDNVQQGDQSTPETGNAADEQSGEAPASAESSSESGPSDGPGGHADANGSADHQFQGEE